MAEITIKELDKGVIVRLEARAARNGRSLQQEVRSILESSAKLSIEQTHELVATWRERLGGRQFSDSAGLLREDRDRR